jgi:ketosteroid isomerase-like protein
MKILPCAVCAAALMTAAIHASAETREEALATLVAAERGFAQTSVDSGYKAAFLGVLAADSTVYQPGPVNGRESVSAGEEPPFVLSWYPALADIAASGDLGFTTGPYTVTPKDHAEKRRGSGHYTSVWRRLPTGAWELVVDLGTPHRPAAKTPAPWEQPAGATPLARAVADNERARLREALLARDAALGNPGEDERFLVALARFATRDARIYRPGSEPFAGLVAASADARTATETVHSKPTSAEISAAGDWGYTLGSMTATTGEATTEAHYMRLWRRASGDGEWTLFLAPIAPRPPPAPRAG